jgi:hypothetical protein
MEFVLSLATLKSLWGNPSLEGSDAEDESGLVAILPVNGEWILALIDGLFRLVSICQNNS